MGEQSFATIREMLKYRCEAAAYKLDCAGSFGLSSHGLASCQGRGWR